jgi:hypothetical protein
MKKIVAIIATACAASFAYGQGTVLLENVNASGKIIPIFLSDGTTQVKGADYKAALIFGGAQQGGDATFANNGRFAAGSVTIAGTKEGGTAAGLSLQVWDTKSGATYAAATVKGASAPFDNPLGGGTAPPPKLVNLQSFNLSGGGGQPVPQPGPVIPEPSTIALGVLGAAALLLRVRK